MYDMCVSAACVPNFTRLDSGSSYANWSSHLRRLGWRRTLPSGRTSAYVWVACSSHLLFIIRSSRTDQLQILERLRHETMS